MNEALAATDDACEAALGAGPGPDPQADLPTMPIVNSNAGRRRQGVRQGLRRRRQPDRVPERRVWLDK